MTQTASIYKERKISKFISFHPFQHFHSLVMIYIAYMYILNNCMHGFFQSMLKEITTNIVNIYHAVKQNNKAKFSLWLSSEVPKQLQYLK